MADVEIVQLPQQPFVGIRRRVNVRELPAFFSEVLPKVMAWLQARSIAPTSPPMAMWCSMDMTSGIADTHAGCFVASSVDVDGEITQGLTAGGDVLKLVHRGGYDTMGQAWGRVYSRAQELQREPGAGWEIYVDDPTQVEPAELRTEIYLPVR